MSRVITGIAIVPNPDLQKDWHQKYMNNRRDERVPVKPIEPHWSDIRESWDYNKEQPEPHICQHFTCSRILTLREQLFGNYCIDHSQTH